MHESAKERTKNHGASLCSIFSIPIITEGRYIKGFRKNG
jgi:hypothetical protein